MKKKPSNTKDKGDISEGVTLAEFLKHGIVPLVPFGDNQRYDLVVDVDSKFIRIQTKTGRIKDGTVTFDAYSTFAGRPRKGYKGSADMFSVYEPSTDSLYLVPVDEVGETEVRLRLEKPKNNQTKGVRMAADYEFAAVVAQW